METAKELKDWFVGERIKRTLAALEKNGFGAEYCPSAKDACEASSNPV